jgi:hypothetical protein
MGCIDRNSVEPERHGGEGVETAAWKGTITEQLDLMAAVQHNCECSFDIEHDGRRVIACSAHTMLARDQRALNGLLWNRHLARRLLSEEGISAP